MAVDYGIPNSPDVDAEPYDEFENIYNILRNVTSGQISIIKQIIDTGIISQVPATGDLVSNVPSEDPAVPAAPTGLTVTSGLTSIYLNWDAVTDTKFARMEIWRSTSNSLTSATYVDSTTTNFYADPVGLTNITYYYWIRIRTWAKVVGPYNAGENGGIGGTTSKVGASDLFDLIISSQKLASGAITLDKFGTGLRPVQIGATLPTLPDVNYPAGALFSLTTGQLYRSTGTGWTQEVAATSIVGTLLAGQIGAGQIIGSHIAANSITAAGGQIAALAVGTAAIQDAAITNVKIANMSADKITAGTITAAISITSPTINGGTINSTTLNSVNINASNISGTNITGGSLSISGAWGTVQITNDARIIQQSLTIGGNQIFWPSNTTQLSDGNIRVTGSGPSGESAYFQAGGNRRAARLSSGIPQILFEGSPALITSGAAANYSEFGAAFSGFFGSVQSSAGIAEWGIFAHSASSIFTINIGAGFGTWTPTRGFYAGFSAVSSGGGTNSIALEVFNTITSTWKTCAVYSASGSGVSFGLAFFWADGSRVRIRNTAGSVSEAYAYRMAY